MIFIWAIHTPACCGGSRFGSNSFVHVPTGHLGFMGSVWMNKMSNISAAIMKYHWCQGRPFVLFVLPGPGHSSSRIHNQKRIRTLKRKYCFNEQPKTVHTVVRQCTKSLACKPCGCSVTRSFKGRGHRLPYRRPRSEWFFHSDLWRRLLLGLLRFFGWPIVTSSTC